MKITTEIMEKIGRLWWKHHNRNSYSRFYNKAYSIYQEANIACKGRLEWYRRIKLYISRGYYTNEQLKKAQRILNILINKYYSIDCSIGEKYGYELYPGIPGPYKPGPASNIELGIKCLAQKRGELSMRAINRLYDYLEKK